MADQLDFHDVSASFQDADRKAKQQEKAVRTRRPLRASITRIRYTKDKSEALRIPISPAEKDRFMQACIDRDVVASQVVRDLIEFWVEFQWIGREANELSADLKR